MSREDEIRLGRDIERGARAETLLRSPEERSPEDVAQLRRDVQRAADARQAFVRSNLKLVVSIAKRYRSSGVALADLVQEGTLGLIHAVDRFDYRKGFKFSTYAVVWIRQAIGRGLETMTGTIRIPRHAHRDLSRVRNARADLLHRFGRPGTVTEIADEVDMTTAKVSNVLSFPSTPLSLDHSPSDGGIDLADTLADLAAVAPEDVAISFDVERLLDPLKDRERRILKLRFGLDGCEPRSVKQVAEHLGLSEERIRQIQKAALLTLRQRAQTNGARDLLDAG